MLNIQTASLRTLPSEPTASKLPGNQASASSTDPAGFASLLRQTLSTPEPPPAPQAEPTSSVKSESPSQAPPRMPPTDSAAGTTDAPPQAHPVNGTRAQPMGKAARGPGIAEALRRGLKPATGQAGTGGDIPPDPAADKTAGRTRNGAPTPASAADAPVDPGLMQWLAGLQSPAAAAEASGASGAKGSGHSKAASMDAAGTGLGDATDALGASLATQAADLKADADLKDNAAGKSPLGIAVAEDQFAATLAEQRAAEKPQPQEAAGISGFKDIASLATAAAAWAPPVAPGSAASPPPVAVSLATPVTAPEFAQTLGVQMSLLARDGIQHAELHLNPADMGPVSVRIAMDGNQAQVDFGADVAATRQAIEAGLPELAGALRDAGFTLTGGGVSQHSRGRDGGDASAAPRSRRAGGGPADEAPGGIHRAVRTTMLLGGLDLYA